MAPRVPMLDERRLARHLLQFLGSTTIAGVRTDPIQYTRRATTLLSLLTSFSFQPSISGVRKPDRHARQEGTDGTATVNLEP